MADVAEQVEQLVAVRVEEAPRDREELVRRHPGLAGIDDRVLDAPCVGEQSLAPRVVADDDRARRVARPAGELGRDVEPDEIGVVHGPVGRREGRMADERARPGSDGDRRPDARCAVRPRELLGPRGELPLRHARPHLVDELVHDLERRPLRRHELGRRRRYPASHRTAWSQSRA